MTSGLSIKYFGKELESITYNDLEAFFDSERIESNTIEFKSYKERKELKEGLKNCNKAVCSFLNAEGGILIWGTPETYKNNEGEDVCKGSLCPVDKFFEKDQLVNQISDSISPLPTGVRIQRVEKDSGYIYVFEVDESIGKPHQYDGVYWVRLDGQKRKAPHYFVESMIKQIKFPRLECYAKITSVRKHGAYKYNLRLGVIAVNQSMLQNEEGTLLQIVLQKARFRSNQSKKVEDEIGLLHYGKPFIRHYDVTIETGRPDFKFLLAVGGKNSPLNISIYEVDPSLYIEGKLSDLSYIIKLTDENKYSFERTEDPGLNQQEIIDDFLNRDKG
ncbi:AlbA family DNA-binding domain-containing protein [Ekhidna sp.]